MRHTRRQSKQPLIALWSRTLLRTCLERRSSYFTSRQRRNPLWNAHYLRVSSHRSLQTTQTEQTPILKVSTVNGSNLSCNLCVISDSTQLKQLFPLHQLRYPSANIFCIIIMQRVSSAISEDIRDEQAAFQVRSCVSQLFALEINHRAMPREAEMMQAVHFNDFQQASIASTMTVPRRLQITGNFYRNNAVGNQ